MVSPRYWAAVVTLVIAAASPAQAQQVSAAGRIKVVSGPAFIMRASKLVPAQVGQEVYAADGLRTGADGRMGG